LEQFKANAVALKAASLGENDRVLTLFTYERGLISARIKGVKKAQAKLKFAQEPFCFGEYMLYEGRGGYTVTGCVPIDLFYDLRADIERYAAGCVMLEYCAASLQEESPDPALFKLLLSCLSALCYGGAPDENALLYFLINALAVAGYRFDFSRCIACGRRLEQKVYIDLEQGGAWCLSCGGDVKKAISPAAYKSLKFMSEAELDRLSTISVGFKDASIALGVLINFIESVAGVKIKSFGEYIKIKGK
jgi:DNA repair protein RecO (recombination protein O)